MKTHWENVSILIHHQVHFKMDTSLSRWHERLYHSILVVKKRALRGSSRSCWVRWCQSGRSGTRQGWYTLCLSSVLAYASTCPSPTATRTRCHDHTEKILTISFGNTARTHIHTDTHTLVPSQAWATWAPVRLCRDSSSAPSPGLAYSPLCRGELGPLRCAHNPA